MIDKTEIQDKIIEETVYLHGDKQCMIAVEEMAELMQAISKFLRIDYTGCSDVARKQKEPINNITEEMADVYITLEELRVHHRISDQQIHENIDYKLERQRKRNAKQRNTEHD